MVKKSTISSLFFSSILQRETTQVFLYLDFSRVASWGLPFLPSRIISSIKIVGRYDSGILNIVGPVTSVSNMLLNASSFKTMPSLDLPLDF